MISLQTLKVLNRKPWKKRGTIKNLVSIKFSYAQYKHKNHVFEMLLNNQISNQNLLEKPYSEMWLGVPKVLN